MFKKSSFLAATAGLLLAFSACSTKTQDTTFDLADVQFKTDTPVTVGSNTMQAEVPLKLEEWASKNGVTSADIEKVTVVGATATSVDSTNVANIESILLQIAGGESGLMEVAVANPIEQGKAEIALKTAKETDVTAAFKSGKPLTVLLDANATADDAKFATFKTSIKFNIAVKSK
jgi:hypothetical protein